MAHSIELKKEAIRLRREGRTYDEIRDLLGLQKSTLNYWFLKLELPEMAKIRLQKAKNKALVQAREKAHLWHKKGRLDRIEAAKVCALGVLGKIDQTDINIKKLALAMLYLGEGIKKAEVTGLGNSDPLIVKYFVKLLKDVYDVKDSDFRCQLHLRMDQDKEESKKYWSQELNLPLSVFLHVNYDKRSVGATHESYRGVCQVRCGRVDIKRELIWLGKEYCASMISANK